MKHTRDEAARLVNWGRFGSHPTDVIGYAFDADIYCPVCAVMEYGANDGGWVPEDIEDVSPLFGGSEWWEPSLERCQRLMCANVECQWEIDTAHAHDCTENHGDVLCTLDATIEALAWEILEWTQDASISHGQNPYTLPMVKAAERILE